MGAFDKIKNMLEDFRFGIRTRGTARTTKAGSVYYASVDCALTRDVLDRLNLGPADTFVDIGAGKGRVLALAARYSVKRIIGIEYEPELAEQARLNLRRMRTAGPPIIIHEGAAEHFDYSDVTVAYLFNPVEADVLAKILDKIRNDRAGLPFRCAYVQLSPALNEVIDRQGWLTSYERYVDSAGHEVGLFCSKAASTPALVPEAATA